MDIIFTRNNTIVSKSIIYLTKEPVSHVALDFGWIIVHSNFRGVHLDYYQNFYRNSEVVFRLKRTTTDLFSGIKDKAKVGKLLKDKQFSLYDFGAMLFLAAALTARRYLNIPLPKSNLWQTTGMYLCTEWVSKFLDGKENSMITPYQLYKKLRESNDWEDYG